VARGLRRKIPRPSIQQQRLRNFNYDAPEHVFEQSAAGQQAGKASALERAQRQNDRRVFALDGRANHCAGTVDCCRCCLRRNRGR